MSGMRRSLPALAADARLRREAGALALYRLAEFGPWVAMLVFAYSQGGRDRRRSRLARAADPDRALRRTVRRPADRPLRRQLRPASPTRCRRSRWAATAVSLLAGAPAVASYALGAVTAMALTVTHPAHAVVSPGIVRTTEQLVALNAVTGWILSLGLRRRAGARRPPPRDRVLGGRLRRGCRDAPRGRGDPRRAAP